MCFASPAPAPPPAPITIDNRRSRPYREAHQEVMNYRAGDPVYTGEKKPKDEVRIQPVGPLKPDKQPTPTRSEKREERTQEKAQKSRFDLQVDKAQTSGKSLNIRKGRTKAGY